MGFTLNFRAGLELFLGEVLDPLDLVKHCEAQAAYFKVPRYIKVIDRLPTSATKDEVERHKLKEMGVREAWDREAHGYKIARRSIWANNDAVPGTAACAANMSAATTDGSSVRGNAVTSVP